MSYSERSASAYQESDMSYCRWSDISEVYAYSQNLARSSAPRGGYVVHVSPFNNESEYYCLSYDTLHEFYDGLKELRAKGVKFPNYALERCEYEINHLKNHSH